MKIERKISFTIPNELIEKVVEEKLRRILNLAEQDNHSSIASLKSAIAKANTKKCSKILEEQIKNAVENTTIPIKHRIDEYVKEHLEDNLKETIKASIDRYIDKFAYRDVVSLKKHIENQ